MSTNKRMTMGLIVGNRGFFPGHLAESGRKEMICALQSAGMDVVALAPEQSGYGAVETHDEAKRCAELFRANSEGIDGVIDTLSKMSISFRRDSFCGKMSACNNLMQYGIPYSLTSSHTVSPDSAEFKKDLEWFAAACRVVNGF